MNPLLYLAGAAGAYFYLKKKAAPIVPMPIMPTTIQTPILLPGMLLGYGGAGNPFYADGAGGIKDASGVALTVATKTLLMDGAQRVWVRQGDGSYIWDPHGTPNWTPTATSPGRAQWLAGWEHR